MTPYNQIRTLQFHERRTTLLTSSYSLGWKRGFLSGPCWGFCPQSPVMGSHSALTTWSRTL